MKKTLVACLVSVFSSNGIYASQFVQITDENVANYLNTKALVSVHDTKKNQLILQRKINLSNGVIKFKYQQYYQGIPVYSSAISRSDINGYQSNWWGNYLQGIEQDKINTTPKLTSNEAIDVAMQSVKANTISNQSAKLFIYHDGNKAKLIYQVDVLVNAYMPKRIMAFVDAHNGQLLDQWDGLTTKRAQGPGGNQKTQAYYYGRDYGFLEIDEKCSMLSDNVETHNMNGSTTSSEIFTIPNCPPDSDAIVENTYKTVNGAFSPINDAHFFGKVVFDMFKEWFNTEPLRFRLKLRVHYGQNFENAFWDGRQMTFGDGANILYPLTSLDVVAHEVAHGFTEQNSNLIYRYQSGGINESFSDIAGESAEYYMLNANGMENDWVIGGTIFKKEGVAMRYFEKPSLDGRSIEHARDYNDSLDVHFSSGVYNKAFYTLATKSDWGIKKAFETFVLANQIYWKNDATYDSAACGVKKAAQDLGFETADVISSFNSVGVDATCGSSPDPDPTPDGKEIELKNGEVIKGKALEAGKEYRYFIEVPPLASFPYNYRYLIIRLFDGDVNTKQSAELYVRFDNKHAIGQQKSLQPGDEMFYIQYPSAGIYHILVKAKKNTKLSIQAYYAR